MPSWGEVVLWHPGWGWEEEQEKEKREEVGCEKGDVD